MPAIFGQVLAQCPIVGPHPAVMKDPFIFAGNQEGYAVRFFAAKLVQ